VALQMIDTLVRRRECVPQSSRRRPTPSALSSTSGAHCRVPEMLPALVPAREGIVVERATALLEPRPDAGSRRLKQFELDRSTRRLLHDSCPRPDRAAANEVADLDFHDAAATQLAVDVEVEQGSSRRHCSRSSQKRIAHTCCGGFSARLAPTMRPAFHGRRSRAAGSNCKCPIAFSFRPHWPTGE
jgi:hypothetical protein